MRISLIKNVYSEPNSKTIKLIFIKTGTNHFNNFNFSNFCNQKFCIQSSTKGNKNCNYCSIIQIFAGLGDSISHDEFGIDGLVSWYHQPLEFGLILCALGGFLIIKSRNEKQPGFGKGLLV